MALRLSADWMVKADDRLLEILDAEGSSSPTRLSNDDRLGFGRAHINLRLLKLEKAGLVEKGVIARGVYSITDRGKEYLAGEFDVRTLELDED